MPSFIHSSLFLSCSVTFPFQSSCMEYCSSGCGPTLSDSLEGLPGIRAESVCVVRMIMVWGDAESQTCSRHITVDVIHHTADAGDASDIMKQAQRLRERFMSFKVERITSDALQFDMLGDIYTAYHVTGPKARCTSYRFFFFLEWLIFCFCIKSNTHLDKTLWYKKDWHYTRYIFWKQVLPYVSYLICNHLWPLNYHHDQNLMIHASCLRKIRLKCEHQI